MNGLDLRLPQALIPEAIRTQQRISVNGEYFVAITHGRPLDISLPRPSDRPKFGLKRFSLSIFDGLYFASDKKTAICEVWEGQKKFKFDLYRVPVRSEGILDLSPYGVQTSLELSSPCFRLANPPDRQDRDYVAWQYLAYAIWSCGFNGIIWNSARYGGNCLCLYRQGQSSVIGAPQLVESDFWQAEWLTRNR